MPLQSVLEEVEVVPFLVLVAVVQVVLLGVGL
jgi:hypothetical protein